MQPSSYLANYTAGMAMGNPMIGFMLSPLARYLGVGAICAILSGIAIGTITHRIDASVLSDLKASDAMARANAIQAASQALQKQDATALKSAVAEAQAQVKIVNHTVIITKEIPIHVQDTSACDTPSLGLVRVLNAAASGADPASITPPAGELDASCSGLSWRSFATDISDDYGSARSNAEQLNALEDSVRSIHDAPGKPD